VLAEKRLSPAKQAESAARSGSEKERSFLEVTKRQRQGRTRVMTYDQHH